MNRMDSGFGKFLVIRMHLSFSAGVQELEQGSQDHDIFESSSMYVTVLIMQSETTSQPSQCGNRSLLGRKYLIHIHNHETCCLRVCILVPMTNDTRAKHEWVEREIHSISLSPPCIGSSITMARS